VDIRKEWKPLAVIGAVFAAAWLLPVGNFRFDGAVLGGLALVKWYAHEHVILCLVPAFFIAGAISVFISQASVMKYLGPTAPKPLAYGVASISGTILAVCSCTVLPMFAGIHRMGAGLGPAIAFLYSGPAINVLAIVLTARILGFELGMARAVGAIGFSVLIGLAMHVLFRREESEKAAAIRSLPEPKAKRSLGQDSLFFASLVAILVFANWSGAEGGIWGTIRSVKWVLTAAAAVSLVVMLGAWFGAGWIRLLLAAIPPVLLAIFLPGDPAAAFAAGALGLAVVLYHGPEEARGWLSASWDLAKQILPLLLAGVLVSGFLLGFPGKTEGVIPAAWITGLVGGNSIWANLFSAVVAAFMYFATLTEVPILQGLIGSGMGKGPALALLLAGPALSLPSMLVLRSIMGTKKTVAYVGLVVVLSTVAGMVFGALF